MEGDLNNPKKSKSSTVSKEVFYEHFKHLFSDNGAFTNNFVETQVNDNVFMNNNNVELLDRPISIEEVKVILCASEHICSIVRYCFKSFKKL